jgi:transposase
MKFCKFLICIIITIEKMQKKQELIFEDLKNNIAINEIANKYGVSQRTIYLLQK